MFIFLTDDKRVIFLNYFGDIVFHCFTSVVLLVCTYDLVFASLLSAGLTIKSLPEPDKKYSGH